MYRYQHELAKNEAIYIAGPECFYTYGYDMLAAMRVRAEALGFGVTLPNNHPLDLENPDLQKRADSIFADLETIMKETTVIISDLEAYRGSEPDSGTIYEIGMAYAKGARSYGYTRDKRSMATKNQQSYLKDGKTYDERGNVMPYANLPFAPTIMGSTKIIEGDFDDCIHMLMTDLEEEQKMRVLGAPYTPRIRECAPRTSDRPLVYLAGFERYDADGAEVFAKMKELCASYGLDAVSPLDWAHGVEEIKTDNPYVWAANVFDNYQQHVRDCDVVLANLNDYRGYEVNNDVGFECGMGFQLGKKLYGYMDNTDILLNRIPHLGEAEEYRDQSGNNVENFDYPANLMFGCSMKIYGGKFEEIITKVAADLEK
ncbi:MAG: nucleoside 2-deoxyribosyltransferase [Lachnospiraceae bacterium]|nr:nucleoside 2-deoxyribosyltransferase [Lachnospiraceae bacterium]